MHKSLQLYAESTGDDRMIDIKKAPSCIESHPVGARVSCRTCVGTNYIMNAEGTVVDVSQDNTTSSLFPELVAVEYDANFHIGGNNLHGAIKKRDGWFTSWKTLDLI